MSILRCRALHERDAEALPPRPLGQLDRLLYVVPERMFDVRAEVGVGEWLHVGPAGNYAYLAVPERGTVVGALERAYQGSLRSSLR